MLFHILIKEPLKLCGRVKDPSLASLISHSVQDLLSCCQSLPREKMLYPDAGLPHGRATAGTDAQQPCLAGTDVFLEVSCFVVKEGRARFESFPCLLHL